MRVGVSLLLLLSLGCSDPAGPELCRQDAAIRLDEDSCLVFADAGSLSAHRATIEGEVRQALLRVRTVLSVPGVSIRVSPGPDYIIPEIGLGGRTNGTTEVHLTVDPDHPSLAASLHAELQPLLAHELHHVARHRAFGFSRNLLEAIVMEGLADHFSLEIARVEPPPWAIALDDAGLEFWIQEASASWLAGPWDHDAWFFGTTTDIPRWAGYSIGFALVARYLEANEGAKPSQLASEPATSFVPASTSRRASSWTGIAGVRFATYASSAGDSSGLRAELTPLMIATPRMTTAPMPIHTGAMPRRAAAYPAPMMTSTAPMR